MSEHKDFKTTSMITGEEIEIRFSPESLLEFKCPECEGSHFGSSGKNFENIECHDQNGIGCRWKGSRSECGLTLEESK